jgi:prepilin-type N-terminal cleavage/methylation domain-containing protein
MKQTFSGRIAPRGVSLMEMSVALAIVGLLSVALWRFLPLVGEVADTPPPAEQLALANEAILGFTIKESRLPCPAAVNGNGRERHAGGTGTCLEAVGEFPFSTLGLHFPLRLRYGAFGSLTSAKERYTVPLPPFATSYNEWPLTVTGRYTPGSGDVGSVPSGVTPPSLTVTLKEMSTLDKAQLQRPYFAQPANINGLDFCTALNLALSTSSAGAPTVAGKSMAYALAHPGARDADDDDDFLDGANRASSDAFAVPGAPVTAVYDDQVLAVGFAELAGRLSCPFYLSRANMTGRGAQASYDHFLFALAILQWRAFNLDLAYDDLQQAYASVYFSTLSALNNLSQFVDKVGNFSLEKSLMGAVNGLELIITTAKASMAGYKLADAIQGVGKKIESIENAKTKRVAAEAYADQMRTLVKDMTERAVALDKKGWLP